MENQEPSWGEELARFGPVSINRLGRRLTASFAPERPPGFFIITGQPSGEEREFITVILSIHSSPLPDLIGKLEDQFTIATREITRQRAHMTKYTKEYLAQQPPYRLESIQRLIDVFPSHERRYQGFIQCLKELRERYPNTRSEDGVMKYSPASVPPTSLQLSQYVFGDTALPAITLAHWCDVGPLHEQFGPFLVRSITRLRYGEWVPDAYFALQCREADTLIDVGIMGKEECDEEGIRQRVRLCLIAFETSLYTIERTLSMMPEEDRHQEMYDRLDIARQRYLAIQRCYEEWVRTKNVS